MEIYKAKCGDGYYFTQKTVFVDKRLRDMSYAQCGVKIDEHGAITFISYDTKVIIIDPLGWMTCTGTYSQTTRKQIGFFLKEYAPNVGYYDAKRCYENHETVNIYTREFVKL